MLIWLHFGPDCLAGPALSGAQAHSHPSAFNVLVRGRKRWFLFPPTQTYWGSSFGKPIIDWITEELP